jgi:hypothetical protein
MCAVNAMGDEADLTVVSSCARRSKDTDRNSKADNYIGEIFPVGKGRKHSHSDFKQPRSTSLDLLHVLTCSLTTNPQLTQVA